MESPSDPRFAKLLVNFSTFCSALAVGFGLLVLIGWTLHIHRLTTILPHQMAVKANTALCFVLLGVALWLLRKENPEQARAPKVLAYILGITLSVVGLISFLEYRYGWDAGVDQFLIKAGPEDQFASIRPGLMSPITAVCFLMLGLALLVLDSKSPLWRSMAQLLAANAAMVCTFGILDFVLDFETVHTFIALPTALTLFCCAFGLIFARREWGIGQLLASPRMGGTLARRLLPAAILIPLVIGWLRTKGQAAGLYSEWTGIAIMTVSAATLLGAVTVWTAFVIDQTDSEKEQAQESARRLAEIVVCSNEAIIGKTLDGIVTSWNPAAEAMYGYTSEEMVGKSLTRVVPPNYIEEFSANMQEASEGKQVRHFETVRMRKGGELFPVSLSVSPIRDAKGQVVGASTIANDISDRKQVEEKVQRVNRTLRALSECTERLMRSREEATVLQEVCDVVTEVAGYRMAWVGYAQKDESRTVRPMASAGFEEGYLTTANICWADVPRGGGPTGSCIRSGETCVCQDFLNDPGLAPWRDRALEKGFRSSIAVPLTLGSEVIGALTIYASEVGRFDVEERRLLEQLASNMTYAIMTVRARAQQALAKIELNRSEVRYRSLVAATTQIVWTSNAAGEVVEDMPLWREFTGMNWEQMRGWGWIDSVHPEDRERTAEIWRAAVERQSFYDTEYRIRNREGEYRIFAVRGVPVREADGSIREWIGTCTDVTDRKRAELEIRSLNRELEDRVQKRTAELRESEQRVRKKLDSILSPKGDLGQLELRDLLDIPTVQAMAEDFYKLAHIPMFIVDLQGNPIVAAGWQEICTKFHRIHPETCKNCTESDLILSEGVAPGEFKLYECKNNMWDVVTPIMVGGEHLGNLFSGQFFFQDEATDTAVFKSQARRYGFDEKEYIAALERTPRLSHEAVDTGMRFFIKFSQVLSRLVYSGIKLARSVEEIRCTNAELAASIKELEAFSYSVSHDLRAPLRHISGFSKLLMEDYGPKLPEDARHHLERIEEGTRRMGQLVDDLLNLARIGRRDLALQVCEIDSIVRECIYELNSDFQGREVEWKVGSLPFMECDPGLVKQVFQNLLSNALKFTRPRKRAVIEVGQFEEDGVAVFYVRDNGVGFSMKYRDKLFGVFQRLHRSEDFEGTGVGLATVQRIVHKHRGRIWAEAELEKGATFYFTLRHTSEDKRDTAASGGEHARETSGNPLGGR